MFFVQSSAQCLAREYEEKELNTDEIITFESGFNLKELKLKEQQEQFKNIQTPEEFEVYMNDYFPGKTIISKALITETKQALGWPVENTDKTYERQRLIGYEYLASVVEKNTFLTLVDTFLGASQKDLENYFREGAKEDEVNKIRFVMLVMESYTKNSKNDEITHFSSHLKDIFKSELEQKKKKDKEIENFQQRGLLKNDSSFKCFDLIFTKMPSLFMKNYPTYTEKELEISLTLSFIDSLIVEKLKKE